MSFKDRIKKWAMPVPKKQPKQRPIRRSDLSGVSKKGKKKN
jgi:hypothetical protein